MTFDRFTGPVWSLFRMVVGLLFACHGLASLFGLLGGSKGTGEAVPLGTWPGWYAAVIQLICGGLVLIGLFTRPAAILASGSMAYAYFVVHQKTGLMPIENGGVTSALYAWSFLAVAAIGAGPWSVEALLSRRKKVDATAEPVTA
ncbi:putative oxidoreductase [Actinoplanes campanulatus]|uniref:Putative oxidoreductase n=1 Tax=Actinoplanes campanulatus TaxID=113559 RepID=A0A7W5AL96_9ACTN|nr:DoxX family protein [Actinoplanes campanulatus]MBB3098137.1 putative oxidoreductase [Actinoplanes campanulatus]GGN32589.1 integral membrane protein [Actinoplanes campanulatus]GID39991.1 integral membrane protein [Actinoplanes campanulatus]